MTERTHRQGTRRGNYFVEDKPLGFFSSGCTLLDCVLGGGYALGRVVNIVGDKSTGKTLLAIEATVNFLKKYEGTIWYHEAESAFDKGYAHALGMPIDDINFIEDANTVEKLYDNVNAAADVLAGNDTPGLYIIDSLDALTDAYELDRDFGKDTMVGKKAIKMSEFFRRINDKISQLKMTFVVISQVRDNIGVMWGKKHKRSGGKSLDFYASQVIWLSDLGKIKHTKNKIERTTGVKIKVTCDKNKVSLPFRSCEFEIQFGYGIDDVSASLAWLKTIGKLSDVDVRERDIVSVAEEVKRDKTHRLRRTLPRVVKQYWKEIETSFLPDYTKY